MGCRKIDCSSWRSQYQNQHRGEARGAEDQAGRSSSRLRLENSLQRHRNPYARSKSSILEGHQTGLSSIARVSTIQRINGNGGRLGFFKRKWPSTFGFARGHFTDLDERRVQAKIWTGWWDQSELLLILINDLNDLLSSWWNNWVDDLCWSSC